MRKEYRPDMDDPLGIHAEVERARLKSRFRDRFSRSRIHPIQHDVDWLCTFVMTRRLRQPGVMDLLRRIQPPHLSLRQQLESLDAIRLLVDIVLQKGSCDRVMKRRCARLLEMCDTLEAGLLALLVWKDRTHND
jgi:hypothetical protein